MKPSEKKLTAKLTLVLVLKVAVLLALWLGFVREQGVTLDAESVAAQFLQPAATTVEGPKP